MSKNETFCRKCRGLVGDNVISFRQRPGRCAGCHTLVQGTICEVPTWIIAVIAVLAIRMHV